MDQSKKAVILIAVCYLCIILLNVMIGCNFSATHIWDKAGSMSCLFKDQVKFEARQYCRETEDTWAGVEACMEYELCERCGCE